MKLMELYNLKLEDYKLNGTKDEPNKLLSMLLLQEKDEYEPLFTSSGVFYKTYKEKIDEKINKVIEDFEFSDKELHTLIEENGIITDDFEHDKIWYIFCDGFGLLQWCLMYHPNMSPEGIYIKKYGDEELENLNEICIKYKRLYDACKKYKEIQLCTLHDRPSINRLKLK